MMSKRLKFQEMVNSVRHSLEKAPDHRTGKNIQYEIVDAGLGAFSVFYMQSPSFLAHQRDMQKRKGQNNTQGLFDMERIPSDGQIRNLLDPVAPSDMSQPFWDIFAGLQAGKYLDEYRSVGGTYLCSFDGTQYFSSKTIHCPNCTVRVRKGEETYTHMVLAAVLVAPGKEQVIALEPEFISPQDGHDKQDCEQQAIKRWVRRNAERFDPWRVTALTDDLHSHQPLCELLTANKMHFILTCKEDSHQTLYQEVKLLSRIEGAVQTMTTTRWTGRYREEWTYRWVEQVPLKTGSQALPVNWCEITIMRQDTGQRLYHNAWITSHALTIKTVPEVVAAGRAHWKVENENFNVLKNRGYNFEHNYGHGKQHLSAILITLLLLAFLIHTVLHLSCLVYQAIRQALGPRRTLFNDLFSGAVFKVPLLIACR
jgi:hypothetical protein